MAALKMKRPEEENGELVQTPQKNKKARLRSVARTGYVEYSQTDVDRLSQDELNAVLDLSPALPLQFIVPPLLHFLNRHTGGAIVGHGDTARVDAILQDGSLMDCIEKRREPGKMVEIMKHRKSLIRASADSHPGPSKIWRRDACTQEAAVKSWNHDYAGSAAQELRKTIIGRMTLQRNPYAHLPEFTQSSGTGKSRAVYELAKEVFCIPVTIGPLPYGGYPPVDLPAYLWLLEYRSQDEFVKVIQAFLHAVFSEAREVVMDRVLPQVKPDVREREDEGTEACVELPEDKSPVRKFAVKAESSDHLETVYEAAKRLLELLYPQGGSVENIEPPYVILCFDEAHSLTPIEPDGWCRFEELRSALRIIVGLPIFSLLLSTKGKLEQFAPLPKKTGANRLASGRLTMYAPIVATPLDVLADRFPIYSKEPWTLKRAASTYHMAHLGRPLFAAMYEQGSAEFKKNTVDFAVVKLLALSDEVRPEPRKLKYIQKLALLAVRLPFNFRTASSTAVDIERKLVSDHLRLLLYADVGFARVVTASASEPLLAEASCSYTIPSRWKNPPSERFDFYSMLAERVSSSQLDLGTRGEMLGAKITLDARDRAVAAPSAAPACPQDLREDGASRLSTVVQYLRALIPTQYHATLDSLPASYVDDEQDTPLKDAFKDGFFNHYVKVDSFEAITQQFLLLALTRGAALVCADGQNGFDVVIPILIGDKLEKSKVTAIFIQVKTSTRFGNTPHGPLFHCINPGPRDGTPPFFLEAMQKPPPIIRMIFALAAPAQKPSVLVRPQTRSSSRPSGKHGFTAYDIWFSGTSRETFGVIQSKAEEKSIATILSTMRDQRDVIHAYTEDKAVHAAVQQMQPLASSEDEHTADWVNYTPANDASIHGADHEDKGSAMVVEDSVDVQD
ncbi:LOW QUALITY PROTEIN: hypothetical protein ACG7TL_002210 [Trametes sanguinea]